VVHLNSSVYRCNTGLRALAAPHFLSGRFLIWQCPTSIEFTGDLPCSLQVDIEMTGDAAWYSPAPGRCFYDPTNSAQGKIEYLIEQADSADRLDASVTGCEKVTLWNLGNHTVRNLPITSFDDLDITGTLSLNDGTLQQPVSIGAASSAETGHRVVEVPNFVAPNLLTGLVSYWKMDEASGDRLDVLGNNNLTPSGTVTSAAGRIGTAARCAAGSGLLSIADNIHQDFTAATGLTIAGWINIQSLGAYRLPAILAKWTTSAVAFGLLYDTTSNGFRFDLSSSGTSTIPCVKVVDVIVPGQWYFVCGTWDGTTMSISVNNGVPHTRPFAGPIARAAAAPLEIFGVLNTNLADCYIDEVGLWNRAFSPTDVGYLYNGGAGRTPPF
jgi:Concanavalin A-like lectin/glucanases superfamily